MTIKVGITGQNGFIGSHLARHLMLAPDEFELISFDRSFFNLEGQLDTFVSQCEVIVHLAAMNRHEDEQVIYDTNIALTKALISALERTSFTGHVVFSSSSQEGRDNLYGKSKMESGNLLAEWARSNQARFTAMVIPNVFGAFGRPYYNSVVATFCHQLIMGESPTVNGNSQINLIYVSELANKIISCIRAGHRQASFDQKKQVPYTHTILVSELFEKLKTFKNEYFENGVIPKLEKCFDVNLFNTFRSFIDHQSYFPRKYTLHTDPRGSFVELIRLGDGGQVSYSTTVPGITRGNHYHTRKIERFSVIGGKAQIELRKVDSDEKISFTLSGDEPAYVDMPIWYTHNISNIGETELVTVFWINEFYDPNDADTYFIEV